MRIVCDTDVVVSAILFEGDRLQALRELWVHGRVTPLVGGPCMEELLRVLTYPKFDLSAAEIESLLSHYLPYAETVSPARARTPRLPRCRDKDDQKFLTLAARGRAQALVTGDKTLLELNSRAPFAVITPAELYRRLS